MALCGSGCPKEIIERFGELGYDRDVSFSAKDADVILTILRGNGYDCVEAPALLGMMRFGMMGRSDGTWLAEVEHLLDATEAELASQPKNR
jgi:hypothetical protein